MRKEILYASIGALYVSAQMLTAIRIESLALLPDPYDLIPAGVMAYLAVFVVANIINEREGEGERWKIIVVGLFANMLFLVFLYLEMALPDATARGFEAVGDPTLGPALVRTFSHLTGIEIRIVIGSVIAFVIAMYLNNYLYHKWKWNMWGKYALILVLAMTIDTVIFHLISYAGILSPDGLLGSIASVTILKIILSFISIPVFAMGLRAYGWAFFLERKHERKAEAPGI